MSRIALYPDPLVAQILAGATYPDQIPDAAKWADQHHYLTGQALADAIQGDQLPWDPSVQALLPFPSVLEMMASRHELDHRPRKRVPGAAADVMDAVQRERRKARDYGYLRSNGQIVVGGGPYITIMPVNPDYVVVPYYDPGIVFFAPRPGFFVGGAIRFGFGVSLGVFFRPWGWGSGIAALTGAGTPCSSTTPGGGEPGSIAAHTFIPTRASIDLGQASASRSGTNWTDAPSASAVRSARRTQGAEEHRGGGHGRR